MSLASLLDQDLTSYLLRRTQQMADRVLTMYTPSLAHWTSIQGLSKALGFANYTTQSGFDLFTSQGVSPKFAEEMIEAATRVNYAQDVTTIHGVGAGVCMVAGGAAQIAGGVSRSEQVIRNPLLIFII